ncbi:MAG: hypothetical protein GX102_00015 [Porphyromonadaceae bacterium]|nr:hypothetical protein [Porphyromonadaceae bacterium]
MINKIIIIILIVCSVSSAYSQDCLDRVARQAVMIDSLQKANNQSNHLITILQTTQMALSDTIKSLRFDLSSLVNIQLQKDSIDAQLKTKSDSIVLLLNQLSDKDQQIASARQQGDQKARAEYERGKSDGLGIIILSYKKPFDDLIKFSSKESVQRDIQLLGNNQELTPFLDDLQLYFNAIEFLAMKFDVDQIKNAQAQLNQIKQNSVMLDKLKGTISNYQTFNDGLKETLNKIVTLDQRESVAGMGHEIQNLKFNKILYELSGYIFNYDFNFLDYPYLSEIVLEIIKRKQPNPDADVADLLNKL